MSIRKTPNNIIQKKQEGKKIVMLTAYDYPLASVLDHSGVDIILVGDSLANVVLGLDSTTEVGMEEMLHHTKAVSRAVKNAMVVGDMPHDAYKGGPKGTVENAQRFIKEGGCDAVKIEWFEGCLEHVRAVIEAGIPVMGHVGLTPQTADQLGGFKVQGKDEESAKKIIQQAQTFQEVGCFSLVLECIPAKLAALITQRLCIPTIGIGAGPFCDGQVLVTHDLIGFYERFKPKFVKQYAEIIPVIQQAVTRFSEDVINGKFPDEQHSFKMKEEVVRHLFGEE